MAAVSALRLQSSSSSLEIVCIWIVTITFVQWNLNRIVAAVLLRQAVASFYQYDTYLLKTMSIAFAINIVHEAHLFTYLFVAS